MSFLVNTKTACILLLATPAIASAQWYHASAPGGQYEGGFDGDGFFISYECGLSASLRFSAKGAFGLAGEATISVDEKQIYKGTASYDLSLNSTMIEIAVKNDYGDDLLTQFNDILKSVASGNKVTWTYPDGTTFTAPPINSSGISSCQVYIG